MTEQLPSEEGDICLRARMHQGLLFAAEGICINSLTDGFCHPRRNGQCKCWKVAEDMMRGIGLSAQAVHYIAKHRDQIEAEAGPWHKNK